MKKIEYNFSAQSLCNSLVFFALCLTAVILPWNGTQAQEAHTDAPGLAIARLSFSPLSSSIGNLQSTETAVGQKVTEVKTSLLTSQKDASSILANTSRLYETVINEVNAYYSLISQIEAKLQLGTTPSNPKLVVLQSKASLHLENITGKIQSMGELSANLSQMDQGVKVLSSEILSMFKLPGALDEDHANLILLSEEATKMKASLGRIISTIQTNTQRQNEWFTRECQYFKSLALAVEKGNARPLNASVRAPQYPLPEPLPTNANELLPSPTTIKSVKAQPISVPASTPLSLVPAPAPISPQAIEVKEAPVAGKTKPLDSVQVPLRPTLRPVDEAVMVATPAPAGRPIAMYSDVAQGRSPLAVLAPNQDIWRYKWYLFSSANRGIGGTSRTIEIVNTIGTQDSFQRTQELKDMLVEMGFAPEQVCITNAKADTAEGKQIVILSGR